MTSRRKCNCKTIAIQLRISKWLVQAESNHLGARAAIEAECALESHLGSVRLLLGGCLRDCRREPSPSSGNRRTVFSRAKAIFKKMADRPQTVADLRVASEYAVAEAACLNTRMLDAQRAISMERPHDRNVVFCRIDRVRRLGPPKLNRNSAVIA